MFLRRTSKSIIEIRSGRAKSRDRGAKELGISAPLPHVVLEEEEVADVGGPSAEKKRRKAEVTSKGSDNGYA